MNHESLIYAGCGLIGALCLIAMLAMERNESRAQNAVLTRQITGPATETVQMPNGDLYKVVRVEGRRFLIADVIDTVEGGPTCESYVTLPEPAGLDGHLESPRRYHTQRFLCPTR